MFMCILENQQGNLKRILVTVMPIGHLDQFTFLSAAIANVECSFEMTGHMPDFNSWIKS